MIPHDNAEEFNRRQTERECSVLIDSCDSPAEIEELAESLTHP